jgi:hypothetical protein
VTNREKNINTLTNYLNRLFYNNQIPHHEGQGMLFSRSGYTQGVNTFLTALKEGLLNPFGTNKFVGIYHVGSSILNVETSNDIDILLIADNDYPISYSNAIKNLRDQIFRNNAINGAFDATDEKTKDLLAGYAAKSNANFKFEYAVGPMRNQFGEEKTMENFSALFHICGPMKLSDYELFFKIFPFHALAFLNLNRTIFGVKLNKILFAPSPSMMDYEKWQCSNFQRLGKISNDSKKFKVLKTMILTKYLFEASKNAYNEAYKKLEEFKIEHLETDLIIKKTCEFCGCQYE